MKKYIYLLLSAFLFIPFIVNAETITYNVCESGCEYINLEDVNIAINNISDLSDKDIVININDDINDYDINIGTYKNMANSITINGNNNIFNNTSIDIFTNNLVINDVKTSRIETINSQKIKIKDSEIDDLYIKVRDPDTIELKVVEENLHDIIDKASLENIKELILDGNIRIDNINLSNILIMNVFGTTNIYNCTLEKVMAFPGVGYASINIYNSKFNELKYKNINSMDEYQTEFGAYESNYDLSTLKYNIYDFNFNVPGIQGTNSTIYFDKEAKLKPGDKLNLVEYLDYYTDDKEIEYTIDDESIAKIENKELIGLKEGSTKVTVTTDDGHVIYRINLVVEKESIPEKIDNMTIKVPITGSKVKAWVLVVSALLLGIIGISMYLLIKNKKVK